MQESEIDMCHSAVAGDVGNPANVKRAVKVTVEKYGRIDLKRDMYQAASLAYKPAFATIRGRFDLGFDAADKESCYRCLSLDPSLVKHAKKADYSIVHNATNYALLALEAKSCSNDLVKTGKYLKDLINAAKASGYQGLQLLGLVSRGDEISIYIVEHSSDVLFTMFKLDTIYIPVSMTSFV
ncbi:hypothetical protein MUCCIDRAFT_79231 [Mucor lusitanicus CBS 277.49]|uniref:Uncharacterized protein n=1 Tax=Mucor lusitanicus CBS 277.49 TaxID=747725 RepID=A0A162TMK3_MUCCL|nr:hypothetical protein MUCCIDRAFT_79231 [Mucor lusitanicus CBS 277.49]